MPSNRNKLSTVFLEFFGYVQELVGQTGDGSTLKIEKVAEGEAAIGIHPIPYIVVQFIQATPKARADRDLVWSCQIRIRIVTRTNSADGATAELLAKLALVQNKIQTWRKPDGVDGFDSTIWSLSFPIDPSAPATLQADATYDYTVAVAYGAN